MTPFFSSTTLLVYHFLVDVTVSFSLLFQNVTIIRNVFLRSERVQLEAVI